MAMAGLGKPSEIWAWPMHYYRAVRDEYLEIVQGPRPTQDDDGVERRTVGPGITIETFTRG